MEKDTYIYGAGHYGVLTALDLEQKGIQIKGFIDKNAGKIKTRLGLPVFELNEVISDNNNLNIIIAVQNRNAIRDVVENLQLAGLKSGSDFNFSSIMPIKPKRNMLRFEVHLCDHCNLNCKSCGHFSPIAEKKFVDLDILERDFKRISELSGKKCENIKLMGGEPLLHPNVIEIFNITRKYFDTTIQLATNGILLANQPNEFWESCRINNINIFVSAYPIKINAMKIKAQASKFGVTVELMDIEPEKKKWFKTSPDFTGCSNIEVAYSNCAYGGSCMFLEDGKLAQCGLPFLTKHFNKYFNDSKYKYEEPTEDDFVDIFKINSLDEILEKFTRAIPYCRYCTDIKEVQWGNSKREIKEWT